MALPDGYDSIRGTARALKCAHPTLILALNEGRIPEDCVLRGPDGTRCGLHVERTRAAMAANTDPVQAARQGLEWVPPEQAEDLSSSASDEPESYHDARADRERAAAAMAQLELATRLGQLVLVEDVEKAAVRVAKSTRDAMMSIPDRCASLLAAETDAARVYALLANEIKQALNGLADQLTAETG